MTAEPLPLLAQGDGWAVVSKPPRLLVHRNAKMRKEMAALQRVRDQLGTRVDPVHRLDRSTSGCLLFATERDKVATFHDALRHPDAVKIYVALVRGGFWRESPVDVDTQLKVDDERSQEASSRVWCLGTAQEPRCSIVKVAPRTGRFHQVRRHLRDLDHPVLGDAEHGDSRENRLWRLERGVFRLQLHCLYLRLPVADGSVIEATSPLFADMAAVWSALPFWGEVVAREPRLALPPLPMVPDVPVIPREWEWPPDDPRRRGF